MSRVQAQRPSHVCATVIAGRRHWPCVDYGACPAAAAIPRPALRACCPRTLSMPMKDASAPVPCVLVTRILTGNT